MVQESIIIPEATPFERVNANARASADPEGKPTNFTSSNPGWVFLGWIKRKEARVLDEALYQVGVKRRHLDNIPSLLETFWNAGYPEFIRQVYSGVADFILSDQVELAYRVALEYKYALSALRFYRREEEYATRIRLDLVRRNRDTVERLAHIILEELPDDIIVYAFLRSLVKYKAWFYKELTMSDRVINTFEDRPNITYSYYCLPQLIYAVGSILPLEVEPHVTIDFPVYLEEEYVEPNRTYTVHPRGLIGVRRIHRIERRQMKNLNQKYSLLPKLVDIGYVIPLSTYTNEQ